MLPTLATVSALLLSSFTTPPATPQVDPPTTPLKIQTLKVKGTGCRPESTAVAISPDNEAFTVTYGSYFVEAGGDTKKKDGRKSCSITVRIDVPAGITYAVTNVEYRGYARLEAGAVGAHAARYHFQGSGAPGHTEHPFASGHKDSWQVNDAVPTSKRVFGACGKDRKLDIDTELTVRTDRTDTPASLVAMDSTDGGVSTYRLAWKKC